MSTTPRVDALAAKHAHSGIDHERELAELEKLARQLEEEVGGLRTDAARYRAIRGLLVGMKWSDTPFFYSAACPPDEKYINGENFDQMADRLCESPQ